MTTTSFIIRALHKIKMHQLVNSGVLGIGAVLMLHHVRPETGNPFQPNRGLSISPDFLETAIAHLQEAGFEFVDLDTVADRLEAPASARRNHKPFVSFTLDDGYHNNRSHALPIFEHYNVPHTIYVPSLFPEGRGCLWWEILEEAIDTTSYLHFPDTSGLSPLKIETTAQKQTCFEAALTYINQIHPYKVREFIAHIAEQADIDIDKHCQTHIMDWDTLSQHAKHPLVTIGGHTVSHPSLAHLDKEDAQREMKTGLDVLTEKLGTRPRHFSYPYGSADSAAQREFVIAKELGLRTAVTTRKGILQYRHAANLTGLPRLPLNGFHQNLETLDMLLSGLLTEPLNALSRLTG